MRAAHVVTLPYIAALSKQLQGHKDVHVLPSMQSYNQLINQGSQHDRMLVLTHVHVKASTSTQNCPHSLPRVIS